MNREVVFTLNNTGIHRDYVTNSFILFNQMLLEEKYFVSRFIDKMDLFRVADFQDLHDRVLKKSNVSVPMNTKDVIIFFSVVHLVCTVMLDDDEEAWLRECLEEDEAGFKEMRDRMMQFGSVTTNLLQVKFLKDNPEFLKAAEKIRAAPLFE